MFQRPLPRSSDAIDKRYRFVRVVSDLDLGPLCAEFDGVRDAFMAGLWKWHIETRLLPLRGGATPHHPCNALVTGLGVDAPVLTELPAIRELLDHGFPAAASMAWLGASPPGSRIFAHVDNLAHWQHHHRVHIPLITSEQARLAIGGRFVHMPAGTGWVFNNSRAHGAINRGPARIHLLLDLPATPEVEAWIARGQWVDGEHDRAAWRELGRDPMESFSPEQLADPYLMNLVARQ